MTEEIPTSEMIIQRYMDDKNEAIVAIGKVDNLFRAYLDHTNLWSVAPDPLGEVMMRQALGGLALYLSCRPLDQISAFTINMPALPLNLFVAGSCQNASVTGRIYESERKIQDTGLLHSETRRTQGRGTTSKSVIEVEGLDLLQHFEQLCTKSDQAKARFFEISDLEYLMVASLPVKDSGWIDTLDRDAAATLLTELRPIDERRFWFQCGCDPSKMLATVKRIYEDRLDELFQDDPSITVSCPRCSRKWELSRQSFE